MRFPALTGLRRSPSTATPIADPTRTAFLTTATFARHIPHRETTGRLRSGSPGSIRLAHFIAGVRLPALTGLRRPPSTTTPITGTARAASFATTIVRPARHHLRRDTSGRLRDDIPGSVRLTYLIADTRPPILTGLGARPSAAALIAGPVATAFFAVATATSVRLGLRRDTAGRLRGDRPGSVPVIR
ncbi:hypothetical protein [Nocardia bovistercoris]|uniref:Uncharacterized protein n=1 Tax=Nocardia bovistercoris TaxID=2785916 RepID=A0A931ICX5_9NOCA|nr:hypothetical protein [Nocardia bovistercoris]MBH0777535.1 hypothetical protein [Nocardia bovistercoris]